MTTHNKIIGILLPTFVSLVYLFLYIPIIVLVVFSFNANSFAHDWTYFTFNWYEQVVHSGEMIDALKNSLIVAISSTFLSITMSSFFIFFSPNHYLEKCLFFFYASLAMPEIVIAVSLLSFFSLIQVPLGLTTLVAGHTLLGLGYVVPIMLTRYQEIDTRLIEASRDLGATSWQTFYTIIIPLLMPALVSASVLVFIISLDDFLISFFCMSASVQTLPLYIFSMIRAGATPIINALSTLLLLVSSTLVLFFLFLQTKKIGSNH